MPIANFTWGNNNKDGNLVLCNKAINVVQANPSIPTITSPANGSTLTGTSQSFSINNPNGDLVGIWVGTEVDSNDLFDSLALANVVSINATGITANGNPVYVRLARNDGSGVQFSYYQYTAHTASAFNHHCANPTFVWTKLTDVNSNSDSQSESHQYSTVQAFNSDNTLINMPYGSTVRNLDGSVAYSNTPFGGGGNVGSSYFDDVLPRRLYGTALGGSIFGYVDLDVNPSTINTLYTASGGVSIGNRQGMPNDAQDKLLLNVGTTLIAINPKNGATLWTRSGPSGMDWCGFSHSGDYYATATSSGGQQLRIFRTSDGVQTAFIDNINHGDFVTDDNGVEYFYIVGNSMPRVRLSNGASSNTGQGGYGHLTARARGNHGKFYCTLDAGGSVGDDYIPPSNTVHVYECEVGENFNTRVAWAPPSGVLPVSHDGDGYARTEMRGSISNNGQYMLVTLTSPQNHANIYLVEKVC